jgi:hypothetical protein
MKEMKKNLLLAVAGITLIFIGACHNPFLPPKEDKGIKPINVAVPVITSQPQNAVYHVGAAAAALTVTASVEDGGTLLYQWYSNAGNSNENGTIISGETKSSYTPPTTSLGVMYYYVIVANTIEDNGDGGNKTASVVSNVAKITVSDEANPPIEETFTIVIDISGNVDGDTVTASPVSGVAGNTITLAYTVANTSLHNLLDFSGVSASIDSVDSAGNGARTYTINADDADALSGVIMIIAVFTHTKLELDPIAFDDLEGHITKTYGDAAFDNAIAAGYKGSGAITYSSSNETVATVDGAGQVTIHQAGSTVIKAEKAADAVYAYAQANYTLAVDPKAVTITVNVNTKTYDGTTTATGTAIINGKIGSDDVTAGGTAEFADKNVDNGKAVTFSGYSLAGTDAGNYTLSAQPTSVTANITAKPVTITVNVNNKTYDGTTTATGTVIINGKIGSDDVSAVAGTAEFEDATAGNGKTVTFSGWSLSGADAGNYSLAEQPETATANITPATLTLSVSNALSPIDTTATVTIISGFVGTDTAILSSLVQSAGFSFDDTTNTLTYNGTTAFTNPDVTLNFTSSNSNYTAMVTLSVYDGQADYTGAGYDRRIPVTQANITAFNTYARTNGLTRHYKLTQSITLTPPIPGESNWTAIGTSAQFTGSFDGQDYTISNLTINTTAHFQGMFGYIGARGIVKNIGLVSGSVSGGDYVGGVVGRNSNGNGTVQNCYTTGNVNGGNYVGGVVGLNSVGTVQNCYATGNVSGTGNYVGGVVGVNSAGTVQNCYATGDVSGTGNYVGGVVGYLSSNGTVQNCYATGDVSGTGNYVGGVVGSNDEGTVRNCYATGSVSGYGRVGGVVGVNSYGTVQNCYATGNVSGSGDDFVGGVVGRNSNGTVQNCYATGNVSGTRNLVGGVVGSNEYGGMVQDCYVTGNVSGGDIYVGGVVGYNHNGTVRNCVALNPSIRTSSNSSWNIGRVVGQNDSILANNYARSTGMTLTYNNGSNTYTPTPGLNLKDGADITSAEYNSQSWWTTAGNWSTANNGFVWDFTDVWEWGANNLPILRNVGGVQNHTVQ